MKLNFDISTLHEKAYDGHYFLRAGINHIDLEIIQSPVLYTNHNRLEINYVLHLGRGTKFLCSANCRLTLNEWSSPAGNYPDMIKDFPAIVYTRTVLDFPDKIEMRSKKFLTGPYPTTRTELYPKTIVELIDLLLPEL